MENEDPLGVTDTHISVPTFLQPNQQRNVDVDDLDRWHSSPLTINTGVIDVVAPPLQCVTAASKRLSVSNESIETNSSTFWFSNLFGEPFSISRSSSIIISVTILHDRFTYFNAPFCPLQDLVVSSRQDKRITKKGTRTLKLLVRI